MKINDQIAAKVTICNAGEMTPKGRLEIAKWLRMHAKMIIKEGAKYSKRFNGEYHFTPQRKFK